MVSQRSALNDATVCSQSVTYMTDSLSFCESQSYVTVRTFTLRCYMVIAGELGVGSQTIGLHDRDAFHRLTVCRTNICRTNNCRPIRLKEPYESRADIVNGTFSYSK